MMRSRLAGLPSRDSSFQLTLVSTPSNRRTFSISMLCPATLRVSPRFMDALTSAGQRADSGTKNSCSSWSVSAVWRGTPEATAASTSSSNRSDNRFRNSTAKM